MRGASRTSTPDSDDASVIKNDAEEGRREGEAQQLIVTHGTSRHSRLLGAANFFGQSMRVSKDLQAFGITAFNFIAVMVTLIGCIYTQESEDKSLIDCILLPLCFIIAFNNLVINDSTRGAAIVRECRRCAGEPQPKKSVSPGLARFRKIWYMNRLVKPTCYTFGVLASVSTGLTSFVGARTLVNMVDQAWDMPGWLEAFFYTIFVLGGMSTFLAFQVGNTFRNLSYYLFFC